MALTITVKVIPSSGRQLCKLDGEQLKCYLKSPPERGQANEELIVLLSKALGIPRISIRILAGATGRKKFIKIDKDISLHELYTALGIELQQSLFKE